MNLLDTEPMMSLDKFIEENGLSAVTVWRYRRKGMLATVNICGRHDILRAEIARFNQRAAAGEFCQASESPAEVQYADIDLGGYVVPRPPSSTEQQSVTPRRKRCPLQRGCRIPSARPITSERQNIRIICRPVGSSVTERTSSSLAPMSQLIASNICRSRRRQVA